MNKNNKLLTLICTWFYSGLLPFAPGTFGSLATLPFVYVINYYYQIPGILIFVLFVSIIGIITTDKLSKQMEVEDPRSIVIDEVAGQSLALLFAGANLYLYAIGFILFRIFDILKPWPVSWADSKVPGGLGIMLDDILAGIMAGAILLGIKFYCF